MESEKYASILGTYTPYGDSLGQRIRFLRLCMEKSQIELAKMLGNKRYGSVARYEDGTRRPTLSKVALLARAGNVTTDWLLTGTVDVEACEKFKNVRGRLGNLAEVAKGVNASPDFFRAIEQRLVSPSKEFISLVCEYSSVKARGGEAGASSLFSTSLSARKNKESYDPELTHKLEVRLSEVGLLNAWFELCEVALNDPQVVDRIISFLRDETVQVQSAEQTRYLEGQIDLLRSIVGEKATEMNALTLKNCELASKLRELKSRINRGSKR